MNKSERIVISNGLICILHILKVLINPQLMEDKELIKESIECIKSVEKQLKEFKGDD